MVLDRKVGDLADQFILLVVDVQALELRAEHLVLRHRRELGLGGRGAGCLGVLRERRAGQQRQAKRRSVQFSSCMSSQCSVDALQCEAVTNVPQTDLERLRRGAAGFVVKPRQQRFRRIAGQQGRERHGRLRRARRACRGWYAASRWTSRRAIMWAVRKSVSANATMTDPSSWTAPKSICRISRLRIRAPSSCARGWAGSKAKRATDKPAAARQRLIDRGGEVAVEGRRGEQAGLRDRAARRHRSSAAFGSDAPRSACWRISGKALAATCAGVAGR